MVNVHVDKFHFFLVFVALYVAFRVPWFTFSTSSTAGASAVSLASYGTSGASQHPQWLLLYMNGSIHVLSYIIVQLYLLLLSVAIF